MFQMKGSKVGQLVLAAMGFLLCFGMWFSTAAFSVSIMQDYGLEKAQLAILASSAMWLQPFFRQFAGLITDRIGAPKMAAITLLYTGIFSILSAFSTNYTELFITRLIVATAGIFFVIGIQHVSQWFEKNESGLAQGIYAGTGNVGAGLGALMLPRIYGLDYHAAFLHLGIAAIIMAGVYLIFGVAGISSERVASVRKAATLNDTVYVLTRFSAIALVFHYAMTFGLEIGLNAWLPGYYKLAFKPQFDALGYKSIEAIAIAAGSLAAVQSFNASLWRPFSGFISDLFQRKKWTPWPFLNRTDPIAPRLHWIFTSMIAVTIMMILFSLAGMSGNLVLSIVVLAFMGLSIASGTGSNFGVTPLLFRKNPGIATGFIGGFATIGGVIYPLIFGGLPNIHAGYALVAFGAFIPFIVIFIIAFRSSGRIDIDNGLGNWEKHRVSAPLSDAIQED
jgi:NNP family nitrate/nitrite transporter-like MFS transporter